MLQLPAALCSRRFPAGGAAQTIKPQTGVTPASVIPGQRGRSVKDVPEAQSGPSLRAQAPAHFVADAKHAVPVVGVGVIAQKEQKIPHGRRFATVVAAAASAASRTGRRR